MQPTTPVSVEAPRSGASATPDGLESLLLDCKLWYVSPYLRALQTAAYALSPLHRRDPGIQMRITPLAKEIIKSGLSQEPPAAPRASCAEPLGFGALGSRRGRSSTAPSADSTHSMRKRPTGHLDNAREILQDVLCSWRSCLNRRVTL